MKIMPKSFLLILLLIVSGLSCKDDPSRELFTIGHAFDLEIVAGLNTLDTHIYRFQTVHSQYDQLLQANGLTTDDVETVTAKSADFGAIFSDVDLDFIREISVQMFESTDPDNRREIFYLDPVPGNAGTVIHPFPALPDVKLFVEDGQFGIEVWLNFRYVPQQTTEMRLEFLLSARE